MLEKCMDTTEKATPPVSCNPHQESDKSASTDSKKRCPRCGDKKTFIITPPSGLPVICNCPICFGKSQA